MNKIKLIASLLLASLVMVSCNDVLDENVNPDKAHVINAKVGLPVLVFYAQQIVYDHSEYYAHKCSLPAEKVPSVPILISASRKCSP